LRLLCVIFRFSEALALKEGAYLGLPKPAVPAGRTDTSYPSRRGPPGDGLRIDPEKGCHFSRRQQAISRVHDPLLAFSEALTWRDSVPDQGLRWTYAH
jgi:hypothetical protein